MQAGYEKIVSEGETFYVIERLNQVVLVHQSEVADQYVGKFDTLNARIDGKFETLGVRMDSQNQARPANAK